MAYSSVKAMLNVSRQNNQPLWDVILQSDLLESGLTRPQSLAEMHHLWQVMMQTSDNYCGTDRSASGFAGGDAAKVAEAEARGQLLTGGYLAQVMAEALKTAECNACMKRIVAAPTAGSCGVLPAVLLPMQAEKRLHRARVRASLFTARRWAGDRHAPRWPAPRAAARPRSARGGHGSRRAGGALARQHRRAMRRSGCDRAEEPGGPGV